MDWNNQNIDEKILKRIPEEIIVSSFILSLGAYLLFDLLTAAILLLGGMTAVVSFVWLKHSITKILFLEKKKAIKSAAFFYALRLILIITLIFIIIFLFKNKILAFAAGFSTIMVAFLMEGVAAVSKTIKWKS